MKYAAAGALMWIEPEENPDGETRLDELYIRDRAHGGFRCLRLVDVHLPDVSSDDDDDDEEASAMPARLQ
jgi:hypothetical protein